MQINQQMQNIDSQIHKFEEFTQITALDSKFGFPWNENCQIQATYTAYRYVTVQM